MRTPISTPQTSTFGLLETAIASASRHSRSASAWPMPSAAASVFSNDDTDQIKALVANHMKFKDVGQMRQSTLKRFVRLPNFNEHLELHRLDCQSSHGKLDAYDTVRTFLAKPSLQVRPHDYFR